ncbi:MAG TPA: hypothetical protein VFF73_05150 [Planctomycetota bacterium]|nr:hypothetical protein [Planctomycetota bacterium]
MKRLLALIIFIAGCASPPDQKCTPDERRGYCEKVLGNTGNKDPWAHYELGTLDEADGNVESAVLHYGAAVANLPPRRFTRPALRWGQALAKLHRPDAARRAFMEVVLTVAPDPGLYKTNPDYRAAALGLRDVFQQVPDSAEEQRVRARFLEEMGGREDEWPGK